MPFFSADKITYKIEHYYLNVTKNAKRTKKNFRTDACCLLPQQIYNVLSSPLLFAVFFCVLRGRILVDTAIQQYLCNTTTTATTYSSGFVGVIPVRNLQILNAWLVPIINPVAFFQCLTVLSFWKKEPLQRTFEMCTLRANSKHIMP